MVCFNLEFMTQGQCEDVLLFHRYLYYVTHKPIWADTTYDAAEHLVGQRFPWSAVVRSVGSSNRLDYPVYIIEGRRPNEQERASRDEQIRIAKELYEL